MPAIMIPGTARGADVSTLVDSILAQRLSSSPLGIAIGPAIGQDFVLSRR
jgi:hypothetical protein